MRFIPPLQKGLFLKRYKRFFADILWEGKTITAHVANTGSMKSCAEEGQPCLFSIYKGPAKRKLLYTLEFIQARSGSWVGVHTLRANALVKELWEQRPLLPPHWQSFESLLPEIKINPSSRIDFLLLSAKKSAKTTAFVSSVTAPLSSKKSLFSFKKELLSLLQDPSFTAEDLKKQGKQIHFIEVKNVTMAEEKTALFPDAVTQRGTKHLREFIQLMERGFSAEVFYVVQREDCSHFAICKALDPEYEKTFQKALQAGLKVSTYACKLSPQEACLSLQKPLSVLF